MSNDLYNTWHFRVNCLYTMSNSNRYIYNRVIKDRYE